MHVPLTQFATASTPPGAGLKFAYASGSRPLEGYTIKRGVGCGGFGEVYYATSDAGKEVALKLIRRNLEVELRGVTQCLNLKHPHLLALYDIRQDAQGDSWVIMEYVSGECLEDAIARHPQGMPVDEALVWMRGVAAAVGYLHDHGIVHRDLKPGNIFSEDGLVKVGDYGLSKFISCSRRSGQTGSVGTVHYMAPEVANGRYGKEIDIYALGIMLYEMLTGRVPFDGESVGEVLMKHLTAEPNLTALEEPFRSAVQRALAKDPKIRLSSAAEFMALLPPNAAGLGASGIPPARAAPSSPRASPAPASPAGTAPEPQGEPVWRYTRKKCRDLRGWWDGNGFTAPQRAMIVIALLIVLFGGVHFWVPMLAGVAAAYGLYWVARGLVLALAGTAPASSPALPARAPLQANPFAPAVQSENGASPTLRRWRGKPAAPRAVATPREKLTDLAGSLLLSSAVVAVISLVMLILRGQPFEANQFAFLSLTSVAGAWLILAAAKLWEGRGGEPSLRRFVMMVLGLCLGAFGFLARNQLLVHLPFDMVDLAQPRFRFPTGFYAADGSPLLLAFVAYFGFLFLIPKWWRQADPLRPQRLNLWSTAVCVFWAAILNLCWPFPQPWGIMLAATISIAVQLSSSWSPAHQRTR